MNPQSTDDCGHSRTPCLGERYAVDFSQNVDATSNAVVSKMPTVDVGLLAATLKVTTTAAFHLDELRIDNIRASASIGEIALKNVVLPYEVLDITLSQIGIETIEVPQLEVN